MSCKRRCNYGTGNERRNNGSNSFNGRGYGLNGVGLAGEHHNYGFEYENSNGALFGCGGYGGYGNRKWNGYQWIVLTNGEETTTIRARVLGYVPLYEVEDDERCNCSMDCPFR